jgi:hypothetical protein
MASNANQNIMAASHATAAGPPSLLSIASVVLAIVAVLLVLTGSFFALLENPEPGDLFHAEALAGFLFSGGIVAVLSGMVLGIAGASQDQCKQALGAIGLFVNALILLAMSVLPGLLRLQAH